MARKKSKRGFSLFGRRKTDADSDDDSSDESDNETAQVPKQEQPPTPKETKTIEKKGSKFSLFSRKKKKEPESDGESTDVEDIAKESESGPVPAPPLPTSPSPPPSAPPPENTSHSQGGPAEVSSVPPVTPSVQSSGVDDSAKSATATTTSGNINSEVNPTPTSSNNLSATMLKSEIDAEGEGRNNNGIIEESEVAEKPPMKKKKSKLGSFFSFRRKKKKPDPEDTDDSDTSSDSEDEDANLANLNRATNEPKTDLFGNPIEDYERDNAGSLTSENSNRTGNSRNTVDRSKMKKGVSFRQSVRNLMGRQSKARGRSRTFNDLVNEEATPEFNDGDLKTQDDESWMNNVGKDRGNINTYFVEDDKDEESDDGKDKTTDALNPSSSDDGKQEDSEKGILEDENVTLDAVESADEHEGEEHPVYPETDYSDAEKVDESNLSDFVKDLEESEAEEEEEDQKPKSKILQFLAENSDKKEVPDSKAEKESLITDFVNNEPEIEPGAPVVARITQGNVSVPEVEKPEKPNFSAMPSKIETRGAYEDFEETSVPDSQDGKEKPGDFVYSGFDAYRASNSDEASKKKKKRRRRKIKKRRKRRTEKQKDSESKRTPPPVWNGDGEFDYSDDDLEVDYKLAEKTLSGRLSKDSKKEKMKMLKISDEEKKNKQKKEKRKLDKEREELLNQKKKTEREKSMREEVLEVDNAEIEKLKAEKEEIRQLKEELLIEHEREKEMGKKKESQRQLRLELKREQEEMRLLKKELDRKRKEEEKRQQEENERIEEERIEEERRQLEETRQMIAELEEEKRRIEEEEEKKQAFELKERKRVDKIRRKQRKRNKRRTKTFPSVFDSEGYFGVLAEFEDRLVTPQFESGLKYLVLVAMASSALFIFVAPLGVEKLKFAVIHPREPGSVLGIFIANFVQNDKNLFASNLLALLQLGAIYLFTDEEPANLRDILILAALVSGVFAFCIGSSAVPKFGGAGLITSLFSHLLLRGVLESKPLYQGVTWIMGVFLVFGLGTVVNESSYELALGGCIAGTVTSLLSSSLSKRSTASYYSSLLVDV